MSATHLSRIQRLRHLQGMLPLPGTPEGECLIISQLLDLMPDGYGDGSEPTRRIDLDQAIASGEVDCGRGKVIDLELRVRGYAVDVLRACPITPAQIREDEPADSPFQARVRVQVPETGALLRWLLGLGENLEVVAPACLRQVMREQTGKAARHYTSRRCRPWRAKRRPVVPGRRRRGRLAGVAEGRSPEAAEARCKRIRYAVKPFDVGPWRSPTAPLGARRDGAVARSGANRGTMVVAERKAKGGLGSPVSHPEHGDTPNPDDSGCHVSIRPGPLGRHEHPGTE